MGQSIVLSEIKTEVPLDCDDPTNQYHLLHQCEERIEKLSHQNKLRKFCMDAEFLSVVAYAKYFLTTDTGYFTQFVGVYSTLSHSPRTLHQSVLWSPQQQQQRAGALTLSSSFLDGSVTPVGPGQNPQYTGAPKAGGGCGLLDKSQPRAQ